VDVRAQPSAPGGGERRADDGAEVVSAAAIDADKAITVAAERRAEHVDARRRLRELHALRAILLPDADDSMVCCELSSVDSQIRAAENVLHEEAAPSSPARLDSAFVWGVDPAISRLAFAFAPTPDGPIEVESLITANDATEGERLGLLDRQTRIFARQLAADYPPACCWVEQPSGHFRNLQLSYAVGVVQAALFETLSCPVWTIPSSAWKGRTVGSGNATKQEVAAWVEAQGADFSGQDEADAYCIAAAGRAMLLAGEWSAAA
jgi:Holliday junction resolvasome RuvABC endonuclease subunit